MFNKVVLSLASLWVLSGAVVFAHGPMSFEDAPQTRVGMMSYMEESMMGGTSVEHEEMEGLMEKMFDGEMSETDTSRLATLMNQYPGAGSMMMMRVGGFMGGSWGMPMVGWTSGWFGLWGFFIFSGFIIWWIVGLFLAIWLWKQINKK